VAGPERPGDLDASDEALLARFVDADATPSAREAAFRELTLRYRRRLFAVCVRVLGDAEDAEDAVQETLVRLARSAGSFRGEAKLSTWLYRVARNVCTDRIRYDSRRPSTPVAEFVEAMDQPDGSDPIEGHAEASALRDALDALDERSRRLLLLVAIDGLTYVEAAEVTGLAVGTVKSRVSRARVRLGELLADDHGKAPDPDPPVTTPPPVAPARDGTEPRGPPTR
jgi:RNA polymerase sigma-70 factor, ECF subfamily